MLITAGVDLSVGSVAILGEVVAAKTIIALGGGGVADACVGVAAGVAVGVLVGIFNGIGVAYLKVPPLIVTLSTLLIGLSQRRRSSPAGSTSPTARSTLSATGASAGFLTWCSSPSAWSW